MGKMKSSVPLVFNSPFELGLRMVYLLYSLRPTGADLQKLVLLDYAIVYSGDLEGPSSLHTPVPFRGGELLSRRTLIEQGLHLMMMRGLVEAQLDEKGITYLAGKDSFALVGSLASPYFRELEERCNWAANRFANIESLELTQMFSDKGHRWGAEIENFELKG
ncbi:MAG: threonine transporter RhtB [Methylotenera sp.]|uniref:ABC-three component system middle component 2 n=1 Tax=Methylotenera sp. TaxID=2051956 RepID=UPI002487B7F9|nr:ABC-three component system middle component 2 [Methylotenera sp.]MDI1308922.1 threonine transporter RhtB [Methylotenera sp.]